MPLKDLPVEVRDLLASLDSTDQLEILLLLLRSPSKIYDVEAIAEAVQLPLPTVEHAVQGLVNRRLIARATGEPNVVAYQYAPATLELHAAAEGLAVASGTHPVAIITALQEKSNLTLRTFADAFRVRKKHLP
jgi:hypothetical protein